MSITQELADALRETLEILSMVRSCAEYDAHTNIDDCKAEIVAAMSVLTTYNKSLEE